MGSSSVDLETLLDHRPRCNEPIHIFMNKAYHALPCHAVPLCVCMRVPSFVESFDLLKHSSGYLPLLAVAHSSYVRQQPNSLPLLSGSNPQVVV